MNSNIQYLSLFKLTLKWRIWKFIVCFKLRLHEIFLIVNLDKLIRNLYVLCYNPEAEDRLKRNSTKAQSDNPEQDKEIQYS